MLNQMLLKYKTRGFELVDPNIEVELPKRGTKASAGYDFFAPHDIIINPHSYSEMVKTNIKAYMQEDEYLAITIRSSLATTKARLVVAQGTAIIDADYYGNPDNDGNIGVKLYNRSDDTVLIQKGERFCQGIFRKYLLADNDEATESRTGGYGSTGK